MATSIIKKDEIRIYTDKESKTVYNIPLSFLQQRHNFGCALVGAWDDLFLLFYLQNDPKIIHIAGVHQQIATVTANNEVFTITFSGTVWDGISVLPL